MTQQQIEIDWEQMRRSAGPYPLEAFNFVREGLNYTVDRTHENIEELAEPDRHITGQELCLGLRTFAIEQYGLLAGAVLNQWKITRTEDFGRIVFAMIEAGVMSRTSSDTFDDFRAVYDFDEAFDPGDLAPQID